MENFYSKSEACNKNNLKIEISAPCIIVIINQTFWFIILVRVNLEYNMCI